MKRTQIIIAEAGRPVARFSNEEQCKYEHRLGLVSRLLQAVV